MMIVRMYTKAGKCRRDIITNRPTAGKVLGGKYKENYKHWCNGGRQQPKM
jgi:hypothetical protein